MPIFIKIVDYQGVTRYINATMIQTLTAGTKCTYIYDEHQHLLAIANEAAEEILEMIKNGN